MLEEQTRARNALFNVASLIFEVAYYHVKPLACPHGNGRRTTGNVWYCDQCFTALSDALHDVAALEPRQRPPLLKGWATTHELDFVRKWVPAGVPCEIVLYPNDDDDRVPIGIERLDMRPLS